MGLSISSKSLGDKETLVEIRGEMDVNTVPQIRQSFEKLIQEGTHLIVNLEGVTSVDCNGLGVFVEILKKVRKLKGDMALVDLSPYFQELLKITGLATLFQTFPNENAAKFHFSFPCADCALFVGIGNCPLIKSLTYADVPCQPGSHLEWLSRSFNKIRQPHDSKKRKPIQMFGKLIVKPKK